MRSLAAIRREITASWPAIVQKAGTVAEAEGFLPQSPTLLGTSTKTEEGEGLGILTAVSYMAPAHEAFPTLGRTLCPWATEGCKRACLGTEAGRMIFEPMKKARIWKATLYMGARSLFLELAEAEARAHARKARKLGMIPAVRMDGSTDTGVGRILAGRIPEAQWYDYTKGFARAMGRKPHNYHVTLSYSGENLTECLTYLGLGGNVAVVLPIRKSDPRPTHLWGFPTISGDESDSRFRDPAGHVVTLSFKGERNRSAQLAQAINSGFVLTEYPGCPPMHS